MWHQIHRHCSTGARTGIQSRRAGIEFKGHTASSSPGPRPALTSGAGAEGGGHFQSCQARVQASWRAGFKRPDICMEQAAAFAVTGLLGPRRATWAGPRRDCSSGRRLVLCSGRTSSR